MRGCFGRNVERDVRPFLHQVYWAATDGDIDRFILVMGPRTFYTNEMIFNYDRLMNVDAETVLDTGNGPEEIVAQTMNFWLKPNEVAHRRIPSLP